MSNLELQYLEKPIRVAEQVWDKGTKPLVTISCITYNHENYIREAIESFLMQKTTFPVEINIHDDASTDGTADIIREYEEKFPKVMFNVIYQSENQYSKQKGIIAKIQHERAQGKYYAICEGDDYWIDPLKLQKQVRFLKENPEYILTHTNCNFLYEEKGSIRESACKTYLNQKKLNREDLFYAIIHNKINIITPSVVFRRKFIEKIKNDRKFKMGDTPLWLTLSQFGKFHFLDEPTTVYRISRGSVTRPPLRMNRVGFKVSGFLMRFYYLEKFNYQIPESILQGFEVCLIDYVKLGGVYNSNMDKYLSKPAIEKIKSLKQRSSIINKTDYYLSHPRVLAYEIKESMVTNTWKL